HLIQGIFFCGLIGQSRKERIPRNVLVKTSGDRCRHLSIPLSYQLCQLTGLMVQYTSVPLASFTFATEGPPMLPGVPVLRLAINMRVSALPVEPSSLRVEYGVPSVPLAFATPVSSVTLNIVPLSLPLSATASSSTVTTYSWLASNVTSAQPAVPAGRF